MSSGYQKNKGAGKSSTKQTTATKTPTPTKRSSTDDNSSSSNKVPNCGASSSAAQKATPSPARAKWAAAFRPEHHSPNQPAKLNLPQVKRIPTTPFENAMSFVAKVIHLQPRRSMFDSRVQLHRQKIVFADHYTLLVCYLHSEKHEDPSDPKLIEGYSYSVTNFRVIKRGEILLHEATLTEL